MKKDDCSLARIANALEWRNYWDWYAEQQSGPASFTTDPPPPPPPPPLPDFTGS